MVQDISVYRKSWSPSVTSQFRVCPIPFHYDTYRGCHYGCLYCFAMDFIEFSRRNKENKSERSQAFIEGNKPESLKRWITKVLSSEGFDYNDAASVAFKERMVVKIGATSDPFPLCESKERITYECLKIFGEYDYPVQISTKNPEVFLEYADEFVDANIAFNVSCSFLEDDIAKKIEVGAIPPSRRFAAVRKLSDMGFKVTVRAQPFILPYSEVVAEDFVRTVKESGAWAFQTEGLKLRNAMSEKEKAVYAKIGEILGYDIFAYYKENGTVESGDKVYRDDIKRRVLQLYTDFAGKYGIRFYNADNLVDSCYGCGAECCGTEFLRNHAIWDGCSRSRVMGLGQARAAKEFGKCIVKFVRGHDHNTSTISYESDLYYKNETLRLRRFEYSQSHPQLLFDFEF